MDRDKILPVDKYRDVVKCTKFVGDLLRGFGVERGQISPFSVG